MNISRYMIWTTSFKETNNIMTILDPHCVVVVSITDVIICVETTITAGRIRYYCGDEMEMACVEMSDSFIKGLLSKKFLDLERKNFKRFLELTRVPKTIDEGLDLINTKGGFDMLNDREKAALDKLTGLTGTTSNP